MQYELVKQKLTLMMIVAAAAVVAVVVVIVIAQAACRVQMLMSWSRQAQSSLSHLRQHRLLLRPSQWKLTWFQQLRMTLPNLNVCNASSSQRPTSMKKATWVLQLIAVTYYIPCHSDNWQSIDCGHLCFSACNFVTNTVGKPLQLPS